ncbi:hypothetical protein BC939DRAFT_461271 [Gamsiella multidivaricata]|uniref:uncharacterized protein n=1 Tax=Gamsiella multidivaricata TaxID=101098 RepID=UPI002220BA4A|nr:uncharacterized protein BC939DRAFT_461271 [Gamsiella multidivaricata]KAI7818995.1 hypothetical protein BC939DRAFT_461271 [Gamsiella multidivaricata]
MESLVEEDEEDEGEEEEEEERDNEDGEDSIEGEDDDDDADEKEIHTDAAKYAPTPVQPVAFNDLSISRALQFASLTGHRPAVKKPVKGAWMGSSDAAIDTSTASTSDSATQGLTSPRGVSFATPLTNYDRPLQKFPRTPHLFDPLTIHQSREQGHDRVLETEPSGCAKDSGVSELSTSPPVGRSAAISRSDLLLPPSALDRVFAPKAHQVLTVEEKMDGANIGFSVLHFKTVHGFAGVTGSGPPPKIRVQNRNHFVHPDDHWQFKKLTGWLENHREDILYLCEGRWRYETRKGGETAAGTAGDHQKEGEMQPDAESEDENKVLTDDGEDEHWTDEDEDEDEYVDEDKVLQDGLAPYVLYGEWLYAKHSVQYTALRSWFVPFDLYDVKTGTFVSRALFRKAIAQTQLTPNPAIQIPEDVSGDVDKVLQWTMDMLQSRSALMRGRDASSSSTQEDRVEGLYFRIDQGDRLLMRSKVVRPDFIVGEERWGTKEQVANQLVYYLETLPDYDNDDDNDNDNEKEDEDEDEDDE